MGQGIEDEKTVEKLFNEALALLKTSDHATGVRMIQYLAEQGQGIEDEKKVEKLYNEALALLETSNYATGIKMMQYLAEHGCGYGYAPAMYQMGEICSSEKYGVKNESNELGWNAMAADRGYAPALIRKGTMWLNRNDYSKALDCYKEAALQGDARAYLMIGLMYEEGYCRDRDYSKAEKAKMAREEAELAQLEAGDADQYDTEEARLIAEEKCRKEAYYRVRFVRAVKGEKVSQNPVRAAEFYQRAAEKGNEVAQYKLGNAYADGKGVSLDPAKAAEWYQKAAEQGDKDAQFELGCMYENGYGVPKDYEKAVEWYRKAANQGHYRAKDYWANKGKSMEWYNEKTFALRLENDVVIWRKKNKKKKILWGIIIILFVILFVWYFRYILAGYLGISL